MRARSRLLISAAAIVGATVAIAACSSESKSSTVSGQTALGTINDHCPVLGFKKVDAEAPVVEYNGHRIGFCCDKCPETWAEWSAEKKDAFVARQLAD